MTIINIIIHNLICLVNKNQGSSLSLPAHGWAGARATLLFLAAHFAKQNTNSVGVQSEGEAEGGCGGNSASPERQFRSKKVRAFSNKGHQTGLPDFLGAKAIVCSPRLMARLARNWAVKSNGGAKSQETIFSEMRRFVPIFCAK